MTIRLTCTGCKRPLKLPDTAAGKKIQCPACAARFFAPAAAPAPAPAPAAVPKTENGPAPAGPTQRAPTPPAPAQPPRAQTPPAPPPASAAAGVVRQAAPPAAPPPAKEPAPPPGFPRLELDEEPAVADPVEAVEPPLAEPVEAEAVEAEPVDAELVDAIPTADEVPEAEEIAPVEVVPEAEAVEEAVPVGPRTSAARGPRARPKFADEDQDVRPCRGGRGQPTEKKSRTGLLVGCIIGLVLLLGGAAVGAVLLIGKFLNPTIADEEWKPFSPPDGYCQVLMPGTPVATPIHKFTVDRQKEKVVCELLWYELSKGTLPPGILDQMNNNERDSVLRSKGTIVSEKSIVLGPYQGREVQVRTPTQELIINRMYLAASGQGNRVYQLRISGANIQPDTGAAARFFNSFSIQLPPTLPNSGPPQGGSKIAASDWKSFAPSGGQCQVLLPGTPVEKPVPGQPTVHKYTLDRPAENLVFMVAWYDLGTGPLPPNLLTTMYTAERDSAKTQGTLVSDTPTNLGGWQAREFQVRSGAELIIGRLCVAQVGTTNRGYLLILGGLGLTPNTGDAAKFFNSFSVSSTPGPVVTPPPTGDEGKAGIADSEWKKFSPPGSRCSVLMPGEPKKIGPAPDNPATTFAVERDMGDTAFLLAYWDLPADQNAPTAKLLATALTAVRDEMVKELKGRVVREGTVRGNKQLPTRELIIQGSQQEYFIVRVMLVRSGTVRRMYQLTATGKQLRPGVGATARFFQSFQLDSPAGAP
jgi:hypothetical protein